MAQNYENNIFRGSRCRQRHSGREIVSKTYGIPAISTGAIIREAISDMNYVWKGRNVLYRGRQFVPDDVVIGIIKERLAKDDCAKGFILDGFPRIIVQAEAFDEMC